jgi:hypothetical protein
MTRLFVLQCTGGQDRRAEEGEGTLMLADRGSSKRKKIKSNLPPTAAIFFLFCEYFLSFFLFYHCDSLTESTLYAEVGKMTTFDL